MNSKNTIKVIKETTTTFGGKPQKIYAQLKKDPEEPELSIRKSEISSMNISEFGEDIMTYIPKALPTINYQFRSEHTTKPNNNKPSACIL